MEDPTAKLPRGILGGHIDRLLKERQELAGVLRRIASERKDSGRADHGATDFAAVSDALKANECHLVHLFAEQTQQLGASVEERTQTARSHALELLDQASLAILQFSELTALQRWIENPLQSNRQALRPFAVRPLRVQACRPNSSELLTMAGVIDILGERVEGGNTALAANADCSAQATKEDP